MIDAIESRLCEDIMSKLNPDEDFYEQVIRMDYGK
jgi:hypothetical protein